MQNQNRDPFNGVYIAGRKIVNTGKITSEGEGVTTTVISDDLTNPGEISAIDTSLKKVWWKKPEIVVPAVLAVIIAVIGWMFPSN